MNTRGRSGQNSANPTSNQGDDLLDYDTLKQTPLNQLIDEIRAMQAHLTEQTAAMQAQATLLTQQSTRLAANERELERLHEERESRRPRSMERSVRYNLKVKSPDPYYGKDHKTLFEFTRQCEAVFNTSGMPETEQDRRIAYAGSYLRDSPSDNWHEILSRGGHLNLTWKEFKKNLMNQLGSTEVFKDRTWMQYHHAQQRPNDTVQSFAAYLQRLRTILADADPEHPITEEQMVQKLRTGVIPIIRNSLALGHRHPATIAEFISDAQLAEGAAVLPSSTGRGYSKREQGAPVSNDQGRREPYPTNHRGGRGGRGHRGSHHGRGNRGGRGRGGRNAAPAGTSAPSTNSNAIPLGTVTEIQDNNKNSCYNCGSLEHWVKDCPHPKKA